MLTADTPDIINIMLFTKTILASLLTLTLTIPATLTNVSLPSSNPIIANNVKIGAFAPPSPYDGGLTAVNDLEDSLGRKIDIINWFKAWGETSGEFTYGIYGTQGQLFRASTDGRTPMISWEPMSSSDTYDVSNFKPSTITSGMHDEYIDAWVQGLKDFGNPVYIRFAHEMNGNWYPWSSEGGAEYVAMWKYVVGKFRDAGATNVKWVWSVNFVDDPTINKMEDYYPGANYVDVHATDVYNCGWRGWQTFKELTTDSYQRLVALDSTKPVWVTEVGTCEPAEDVANSSGKSKTQWIIDMFNTKNMPNIEAIIFFNENSRKDWRLTTNTKTLPALKSLLYTTPSWTPPTPSYVTETVKLTPPTNIKNFREYTKTKISWDPVEAANGYLISKNGTQLAYIQSTTYQDFNLNPTETYTYTVTAVSGTSKSTPTVLTSTPNSIILKATTSGTHAYLQYVTETGKQYQIKQNGTIIKTVTAVNTQTRTDIYNLSPNTKYNFQITTINGEKSDIKYITTAPPAPEDLQANKTGWMNKNIISWSPAPSATYYKIYRNGNFIVKLPATLTTYTDLNLTPNTPYTYTVRSEKGYTQSFPSSPAIIKTTPPPPNKPTVLKTNSGLKITWNTVPNVKGYAIYRDGTNIIKTVTADAAQLEQEFTTTQMSRGSHTYNIISIYDWYGATKYSIRSVNSNPATW